MKMSKETFELLKPIKDLITPEVVERYRARDIARGENVKDINMRLRWDAYHAFKRSCSADIKDKLYWAFRNEKLNDSHIDTALRRLVPNIE